MSSRNRRIIIIENRGSTNVGESFERGARKLGIEVRMIEPRESRHPSI